MAESFHVGIDGCSRGCDLIPRCLIRRSIKIWRQIRRSNGWRLLQIEGDRSKSHSHSVRSKNHRDQLRSNCCLPRWWFWIQPIQPIRRRIWRLRWLWLRGLRVRIQSYSFSRPLSGGRTPPGAKTTGIPIAAALDAALAW